MIIKIKISEEEMRRINRKANREAEIENGSNFNRHRVHKNKKAYSRKEKYNSQEF
jgi:hypothetical protein